MEISCASVTRDAHEKQQESQNFKKKCPSGICTTKIRGGESDSLYLNSQNEFPGPVCGCDMICSEGGGTLN